MFKKSYLFTLLALFVAGIFSYSYKESDPIEKVVTSLKQWVEANPQEKVYLHTDKPYYTLGDTLRLKGYVTTAQQHRLSVRSGSLYVDLINEGDSISQSIKLPLISGTTAGYIILTDSLMREGNYRLRAYTQLMRNAGPDYFYDKTIQVGSTLDKTVLAQLAYIYPQNADKTTTIAQLTYTDESGKPYIGKTVRFELKNGYKVISSGNIKTNELGQLAVKLPEKFTSEKAYLLSKITLNDNDAVVKTFPFKALSTQTDVQFFPEGGNLLLGIKTRVAFKATGVLGLGVPVKGTITDNEGQTVADLQTKHAGMGYFSIKPEAGKTYQTTIQFPDGSSRAVKLPVAQNDGYALSVYADETDTVLVRVHASDAILQKGSQQVSLVAQAGGEVLFSVSAAISKTTTSLYFPIKEIPSGILQFTLFSSAGEPLNERIVFVQHADAMQLKLSSSKNVYKPREKVSIDLEALKPVAALNQGSFSVSVINEAAVPVDEAGERTIFSELLLSSDIKGYIEKPNYYFHNPNDETRTNLDILMLTQGYRRFVWKEVMAGNSPAPLFKPEKQGLEVTGKLSTFGKKPVVGGKVILFNKYGFVKETVSVADGKFEFKDLVFADGIDFTLQGKSISNKNSVVLKVDKVAKQAVTPNKNLGDFNQQLPAEANEASKQSGSFQKANRINTMQNLMEVQIISKKRKIWRFLTDSQMDQVYRPDENQNCDQLRFCIQSMKGNKNVSFRTATDNSKDECGTIWIPYVGKEQFTVIIDNFTIEPCDYQSLLDGDAADIDKIYFSNASVSVNAQLFSGITGPVMAIFTKSGDFRRGYNPSVAYIKPKGFTFNREFYSPKYNNAASAARSDFRTTIYWNPFLLTDQQGKATFNYFNADTKGTYRVVIEGINADGELGRAVYRYKVE